MNNSPPPRTQEQAFAEMMEGLMKFQADQFSTAKAFLNLVIIAGYAAFFAIWSFTKESISPRASVWAALMLTVSATLFISWETYVMYYLTTLVNRFGRSLKGDSPDQIVAQLKKFGADQARRSAVFIPIWTVVVPIIYLTALAGVVILGYQFLARLIGGLN